jgi:hypothetical protein
VRQITDASGVVTYAEVYTPCWAAVIAAHEPADQRLQLAEKIYATLSQVYGLQPDQEFGVNLVLE